VLDLGGRLSQIEGPPPPPEDATFGGAGIAVRLRIYLSIKQWFTPTWEYHMVSMLLRK
jgi:hypothetical protein